jgi:uncharacterized membrane protein
MIHKHAASFTDRLIVALVILSVLLSSFPVRAAIPGVAGSRVNQAQPASAPLATPVTVMTAAPLSLARVQSSYVAGTTTITFLATNNLPPTILPEISETASYTETIDALAAYTASDDVNTLRQVTIEDTLAADTTLITASGVPILSGNNLTWSLPEIPPLGSVTVTMTVQTPAAGADFVNLDSGAQINAQRWGEPVSTIAPPAVIVPSSLDVSYTQPTPEADIFDEDMLWKTAQLAQNPLAMFELVRSFGNDPYEGLLRGTRGTLWGEAGNAADKSSLLIAMLRAAGIPARYRNGSLSSAQAKALLASMFPDRNGVAGYLPDGTQTADPLNDPALINRVADHWWVEAYLPGQGWTNLDPSFPTAQPGDIFATPSGSGSDRVAALPGSLSYTVQLELQVEQYSQFPIGGANLTTFTPLSASYTLAQLASKSLTIGHVTVTEAQGGAPFTTVTHTYSPFFTIAGEDLLTYGDEFQDLLSNFPLASHFTTAEWLVFTLTSPDGNQETFKRELKDLIGLDARLFGGNPVIALPADNRAFTSFDDAFATWFLPNQLGNVQYARRQQADNARAVIAAAQAADAVPNPLVTAEDKDLWRQGALQYFLARNQQFALAGLEFAKMADPAVQDIESNLRVKLFYDQPRLIITSSASQPDGSVETSIDLRSTKAAAIVYPGQAAQAELSAQWIKGVVESYYETEVAARLAGTIPVSVARLFDALHAEGDQPVLITPNSMDMLDLYHPDRQAVAYARQALLEGKNILIPPGPVLLDGEEIVGWWEMDPQTGEAISVLENGQHTAALETIIFLLELWDSLDDAKELQEATAKIWTCIVEAVVPALQGNPGAPAWCLEGFEIPNTALPPWVPDPLDYTRPDSGDLNKAGELAMPAISNAAPSWRYLPAYNCPVGNCGIEQFVLPYTNQSSIPLPEMLFGYNDRFGGQDEAGKQFSVFDNGDPGAPAFSLETTPTGGSILPGEVHTIDLTAEANFSGELRAWVYAPQGWQVRFNESGQLEVVPLMGTLPGNYTLQIVAQAVNDPNVIATVEHQLNIPDANDLLLASFPDPNISLPSGDTAFAAVSNETNDGEGEYPDSAYRLVIANYAGQSKSLTLTASGAPASWVILDGARQTSASFELGANQRTQVGLYILPESNPAPGTSFTLNVQLSDGLGQMESVSIPWSMPGQAHSFIQINPTNLYLGSDSSVDFNFSLKNVGNTAGSFPVSTILPPVNASIANLPALVSLAVGEQHVFTATLDTVGILVGTRFPLLLSSQSPDSYTQYSQSMVQIVSPLTEQVFQASDQMAIACTLGEPQLSAALQSLALAMVRLETSCQSGNCSLDLRNNVVDAAQSVVLYAGAVSPSISQDDTLSQIAALLATHTTNSDILADLADLSEAVASTGSTSLVDEVCALSWHMPVLRWTPAYSATLSDQPTQFTLGLTNQGMLPTTYALTVTLPSGVQSFSPSVDPGETTTIPASLNLSTIGLYDLDAEVSVVGEEWIRANASARLNVVDRFVQLTAVNPDPSFVETGVSSTTISVDISNIANLALASTARTTILEPGEEVIYSNETPITILAGAPRNYLLQTVDTSGWAAGTYTVTVDLLNSSGTDIIPDGTGYGYLGIGQALGISHAVSPLLVNPGTVTVTTQITSEVLAPVILPPAGMSPEGDGSLSLLTNADAPVPLAFPPEAPQTTDAITRTDDLDASIIYTGTWTAITTTAWTRHTSQGSYTVSDTAGDTATFALSGTWLHLGFATDRDGGQAEILIDGTSHGIVDTYSNQVDVASFVYSGLANTAHTLTINVLGTAHPNAIDNEVKLDYIDTWDGTLYPDGLVEQTSTRVWRSRDWSEVSDTDASGGSYMTNNISGNAWFPFTGDSVTLIAFANYQANRVSIYIDGVWQVNPIIYNSTDITRTVSFDNLSPGPHVMQVRRYYNNAHVDGFITPAIEPGYTPPSYTGIVRYEADHPAMLYNGYPWRVMPQSWSIDIVTQASDTSISTSNDSTDTASLTFDGQWVSIGLRTRNRGGLAEVYIDGTSYGLIDSFSDNEDVRVYNFGGLAPGTHTLEIQPRPDPGAIYDYTYLDYIDVWDGSIMPDDFANAHKAQESGRLHYSNSGVDETHPNALQGDFVASGLPNTNSNVWYTFTGDSFTLYGFTRQNTSDMEVFVDGQLIDTISLNYPFSQQPLAFHYTGFEDGPHSVRVHNIWEMRVDGFASNPASLVPYQPIVEWYDDTPAGNGAPFFGTYGIAAGMAAGDVNGDGVVEIVVTADDVLNFGSMFVYRGDGGDTGDGDPILWMQDFGGGTYRTWVSSPALADLDGQPGAEIVVAAGDQLYAFHGDGSTYWITDTVNIFETLTSPAIGNLDSDPEPEIVVNVGTFLEVRQHDGLLTWSTNYLEEVNPPVLADLTGDGLLDILVTGWDDTVMLYDYSYGSPQLAWSINLPTSMAGTFGAPAIADIDGMQPGGDPEPEVVVSSNGLLSVLNGADGSLVWATQLDPGNPGGVSIADLDGDGEIEILTGMRYEFEPGRFGKLYALNADGSLLWDAIAEDSSSANNAAALDLDGDGSYEVAWNGKEQGFTIFSGLDGSVIFNEPLVYSLTGTDYPLFVDVDNDGFAEVVSAALGGVRVFGLDNGWGPARPLWNQHSYHITNVNDDLSIPFSEPDSWVVHNTYRTQTELVNPLPVYSIALTHTVGLEGVSVLTGTFNIPPDSQAGADYGWKLSLGWESTLITHTFNSELSDLLPGETRLVAQGTRADYTLASGQNQLLLPPLYASAAHIVTIDPPARVAGPGGNVEFSVVLTNTTNQTAEYQLNTAGLPAEWTSLAAQVSVPAGTSLVVPLSVLLPLGAAEGTYPFGVAVSTDQVVLDQASAELLVIGPLLEAHISPAERSILTGETVTYTLTITNLESVARTYDLSGSGLVSLSLPSQTSVSANSSASLVFNALATHEGTNPFTVEVTEVNGFGSAQTSANLTGVGQEQVQVVIDPASASGGPAVSTLFEVEVINLGSQPDVFDLSVDAPPGWQTSLALLGAPVSSILVGPGSGNAVTLQLQVTPPAGTAPGDYSFTVAAQSSSGGTSDSAAASLQVGNRGVQVEIISGLSELEPDASGTWQVRVTNTGITADSYDLSVFGELAPQAQVTPSSLSLVAGQSQTVQLTAGPLAFALPQEYILGILAQSQADADIRNQDIAMISILEKQAVEVAWLPESQTVNGLLSASFSLVITNTGNLNTAYQISGGVSPQGVARLQAGYLELPARSIAVLMVDVEVPRGGVYQIDATAQGGLAQETASAGLTVIYESEPPKLFLPVIFQKQP